MPRLPRRDLTPTDDGRRPPAATPTPRTSRVRLDPELRRAEVLDHAMATFAAHGFAGATFADVAARAGVSKGAVYHYFETKEALFEAVIQERLVPTMATDEALLAAGGGAAARVVEQLLARLWDTVAQPEYATLAMIALLESARFPALGEIFYRDVIVRWRRTFDAALSQATAAGDFPAALPVESLARSVPPMIVGAVLLLQSIARIQQVAHDGAAARRHKAATLALIMAGFRAGAAPAEPRPTDP